MGRLLALGIFLFGLAVFVSRALAFFKQISGDTRSEAPGSGFAGPVTGDAARALPAVQPLVQQFIAAGRSELPKRLDELSALVRAVESAVRQRGLALEPHQVKDLVARALAAQLAVPDYQVRTLLDFV